MKTTAIKNLLNAQPDRIAATALLEEGKAAGWLVLATIIHRVLGVPANEAGRLAEEFEFGPDVLLISSAQRKRLAVRAIEARVTSEKTRREIKEVLCYIPVPQISVCLKLRNKMNACLQNA